MRKYTLASLDARQTVDLRNYIEVIESAVHKFMPEATVRVEQDCYYVSPTPTQGTAVRIGRQICKSALNKHCIRIAKLFSSVEIEEEMNDRKSEQQRHGGYC